MLSKGSPSIISLVIYVKSKSKASLPNVTGFLVSNYDQGRFSNEH